MAKRAAHLSSIIASVIACLACLYLSFSARLTGKALERLNEFGTLTPVTDRLEDFTFRYLLVIAVFIVALCTRAYLRKAVALITFILSALILGLQIYLLVAHKVGYVFYGSDIGWFYIAFVLDILIFPSMAYALAVGLLVKARLEPQE